MSRRLTMFGPVAACRAVKSRRSWISLNGHLRPFMPQKLASPMTGLKCTADVARRRTRNEKIYYAGARRSVIIAAQNTDRRAAVSEIELALSTLRGHRALRIPDIQRTDWAALNEPRPRSRWLSFVLSGVAISQTYTGA